MGDFNIAPDDGRLGRGLWRGKILASDHPARAHLRALFDWGH
jgi:hypothetical protein